MSTEINPENPTPASQTKESRFTITHDPESPECDTFTAEWADGQRLSVICHADHTVTIRIGSGGQGPKVRLSDKAARRLADLILFPNDED